ncbi:MAG TPA: beta-ketoacyl synthase N-terminal-like domain-containing protein [Chitinolyticbacter sp.]|nr:beta-ketoacyl synthase N-terminal-like domain-containing protein [Chitinolyticbacter sp.]
MTERLQLNGIRLVAPSVFCAQGEDWQRVRGALDTPVAPAPAPWPACDFPAMNQAWAAPDPALTALGVDRKLARTMEKQARMMLAAACASLAQLDPDDLAEADEVGLYLGLPTVDEAVPTWAALQGWHDDGGQAPWGDWLMRETPPFSGLSMLNSSAAAHIAATAGISGPLAVYSPQADAGLNALIDGVLAVAEAECAHALIGAVSPKLDPLLPLQYGPAIAPSLALPPGEVASALLASRTASSPIRLAGYARALVASAGRGTEAVAELIAQALSMAGRAATDIGWVLHNQPWQEGQATALRQALARLNDVAPLPTFNVERHFGRCGPASGLLAAGLAHEALSRGELWHEGERGLVRQVLHGNAALLIALAPLGQCVVVVLGREVL